jgi:hypothetical protein
LKQNGKNSVKRKVIRLTDGTPLSAGAIFAAAVVVWILLGKSFKYVLKWILILVGLLLFAIVLILKGVGII